MNRKDKELLILAGGTVAAVLGIAYVLKKVGEPSAQAASGPILRPSSYYVPYNDAQWRAPTAQWRRADAQWRPGAAAWRR